MDCVSYKSEVNFGRLLRRGKFETRGVTMNKSKDVISSRDGVFIEEFQDQNL